jgi:hypothetical protein
MRTSKGSAIMGESLGGVGGRLWDLVMFGSYAELQFGYMLKWFVAHAVDSWMSEVWLLRSVRHVSRHPTSDLARSASALYSHPSYFSTAPTFTNNTSYTIQRPQFTMAEQKDITLTVLGAGMYLPSSAYPANEMHILTMTKQAPWA